MRSSLRPLSCCERCGRGGAALGCAAGEVEIDGTRVVAAAAGQIAAACGRSPDFRAEARFSSNKRTYSYGAHAAHVAVDPRTGQVELLDYVAVEDVGRIINPLTLHGQTVGAIVQGLGGALLEHSSMTRTGSS